jgi:hypothetical protein
MSVTDAVLFILALLAGGYVFMGTLVVLGGVCVVAQEFWRAVKAGRLARAALIGYAVTMASLGLAAVLTSPIGDVARWVLAAVLAVLGLYGWQSIREGTR